MQGPDDVAGAIRDCQAGLANANRFGGVTLGEMIRRQTKMRRHYGWNVERTGSDALQRSRFFAAGNLPREIEVLLRLLLRTSPQVNQP